MDVIDALLMGLLQGLTEYLPVSSSGHLAIASHFFGIEGEANLTFTVAVHVATVFSTLVILWKDIVWIFKGLFDFKGPGMNESQRYALNILVSMIPVGIVGVFFKDYVEMIFGSGLLVVGICLLLTALLLTFSYYARPRQKENISLRDAFVIGLLQVERRRGSPQTERGHILFRMGLKFLYPLRCLTGADEQDTGGQRIERTGMSHFQFLHSQSLAQQVTYLGHQPERRPLVWLVKSQYFSFLEIHLSEF